MAMVLNNVKRLASYDACAAYYAKAHSWRTLLGVPESEDGSEPGYKAHPEGSRALDPHNHKRYLSIRPTTTDQGEPAFVCRYRRTDVVTWVRQHDGSDRVTVRGYESMSTAVMAEALTPNGIRFTMHLEDNFYAFVPVARSSHTRVYAFADTITFTRHITSAAGEHNDDWLPYNHTHKAMFIDAGSLALTNALRRTRYFDFIAWVDAVMAFDRHPLSYQTARSSADRKAIELSDEAIRAFGVLACLEDPSKWVHLLNNTDWAVRESPYSVEARKDSIKRCLRETIYQHFKAVPTREVSWYDKDQFDAQRALRRKYPWAV